MPRIPEHQRPSFFTTAGRRVRLLAGLAVLGAGLAIGPAQAKGGNKGRAAATVSVSASAPAPDTAETAVPGQILLKLSQPEQLPGLLVKYGLTLDRQLGSRPIFRLQVIGGARVSDKIAALALEPGVLLAEPNHLHAGPEAAKNNVWAIGSAGDYQAQWAPAAVGLPGAWQASTGAGVRVAVLDTGVDASHPLLTRRLLPGWDFVDHDADPSEVGSRVDVAYGHGTHVAGLVALAAPGARILPLRVLDTRGGGDAWALAEAMLFAVDPDGNPATDDGAQVINLSLAGPTRTRLLDSVALLTTCNAPDPTIPEDDLSHASYGDDRARCTGFGGAVVVAAAGNDGSPKARTYPAAEGAYGLIAVAASGPNGRLAPFSNSGSWIQMAAPGVGLTSSVPGGWGTWSGTSMAAPLVAGAAAFLRSAAPWIDAKGAARCLVRTARGLDDDTMGQLDAQAALRAIGDRGQCR